MIARNDNDVVWWYDAGYRLFVSEIILNEKHVNLSAGVIYRKPLYSVDNPDRLSFYCHGIVTYRKSKYKDHLALWFHQNIEFTFGPNSSEYFNMHQFLMFKTKSELFEHILTKWPPILIIRFKDDIKRLQEILV